MAVAALGVLVVAGGTPASQRSDEVRLQEVAVRLKCLQCVGESVAASQAPLAEQFRTEIAEQIDRGVPDDQIIDYFVDRYGEEVLLDPATSGISLLVWLLPAAVLVAAVVGLWFAFARWRGSEAEESAAGSAGARADQESAVRASTAPTGATDAASGAEPPDSEVTPPGEPSRPGSRSLRLVALAGGLVLFVGLTTWLVVWGSADRGGGELTGGTGTVSGELARCQPLARQDPRLRSSATTGCWNSIPTARRLSPTAAGPGCGPNSATRGSLISTGPSRWTPTGRPPRVPGSRCSRQRRLRHRSAAAAVVLVQEPSDVARSVVSSEGLEREVFFGLMGEPTRNCWQSAAQAGEDRGLDQQFLDDLGACLDLVLATTPDDPDAMLSRAMSHIGPEKADPDAARELLSRLLAAEPDNSDALALEVSIDIAQGNLDVAREGLGRLETLPRGPAAFLIGDVATLRSVLDSGQAEEPG
ncbi:MAG: cytochrome c-type biogenesis protein CcmH [Microthrixaceae bacterium]